MIMIMIFHHHLPRLGKLAGEQAGPARHVDEILSEGGLEVAHGEVELDVGAGESGPAEALTPSTLVHVAHEGRLKRGGTAPPLLLQRQCTWNYCEDGPMQMMTVWEITRQMTEVISDVAYVGMGRVRCCSPCSSCIRRHW